MAQRIPPRALTPFESGQTYRVEVSVALSKLKKRLRGRTGRSFGPNAARPDAAHYLSKRSRRRIPIEGASIRDLTRSMIRAQASASRRNSRTCTIEENETDLMLQLRVAWEKLQPSGEPQL
jgi:hypothetical protein